jgi:hypothetical protein
MTIQKFKHLQPPPSFSNLTDVEIYVRNLHDALFRIQQGKIQCVGEITLTANAAATVLTDSRISIQSAILFDPRTANAATEYHGGTMYILDANRGKGTCTITHANNAQVDRTFFVALIG